MTQDWQALVCHGMSWPAGRGQVGIGASWLGRFGLGLACYVEAWRGFLQKGIRMTVCFEWALSFNRGVSINIDDLSAEDAHKELERIEESEGQLRPEAIVEAARPRSAKLHNAFEWNDKICGQKYRVEQAKLLSRSIKVRMQINDHEHNVRAWSSIRDEGSRRRVYVKTQEALATRLTRDELLMQALNQLRSWRRKWHDLNEMADAIPLVDQAVERIQHVAASAP